MKTDIQISQENKMEEIQKIADKLKIEKEVLEPYGRYMAKLDVEKIQDRNKKRKLILVTAINPTKAGEGKSTTTIALADGLTRINKDVIACLREPSLGPVFGLKGGAAGGGYAQVQPMEEINLHFTGDMHALTTATNLISAVLDNHIYQGNELNIDPTKVVWKRCLDMNDRTLRDITIAQNKKTNGVERVDHFCITVASETMAILCLSKDLKDFEHKIGKAIVAYTYDDKPVTVKDLNLGGALSLVMKQAIKPNLVQTLEHTPVLVHGGPFANIAHGCNSIIATKLGLKLADYVVTEAGFGADLGAEKFMNIKCRMAGLQPSTVVLVATCRALKLHGGVAFEELDKENIDALKKGLCNLDKHLDSVNRYGVPVVVAVNRFLQDTQNEVDTLVNYLKGKGIEVAVCEGFAKGSEGAVELANKVVESCEKPSNFKFVYEDNDDLRTKIEKISKVVYGATNVEFSDLAKKKLEQFKIYNSYPVCMAKTPLSLTDDPKVLGRPKEFTIHVNDLSISNGAGFVVAYTGSIMVMPGLPKVPAACKMGIDDRGETFGLF